MTLLKALGKKSHIMCLCIFFVFLTVFRFGSRCFRIFRLLLVKKHMEQKQVQYQGMVIKTVHNCELRCFLILFY